MIHDCVIMFNELFGKGGLSLDRLQTLCEVAEKGSIGEATKGDTNRQTQFSRQISELEKFFGVELLNRESRPYRLSEEGRQLSKLSRDYLGGLSDFKARCGDRPVKLVIGAGEGTIQWLLLPMLEKFTDHLPNASISMKSLRTLDIIKGLIDGDVDLGFVRKTAVVKPLKSTGKWQYGYRLFIPRRMRKKLEEKVSVSQLASIPLALIGGQGEFRRQLDGLVKDASIDLDVRLECSSHAQVATAILSGKYGGFLPNFATRMLPEAKIGNYEVSGFENLKRQLVFAWNPKQRELRPVIDEAIRLLRG